MIGVDQIDASRLHEVNRIIETSAWGASHAELHPTHDYKAIGIANHEKAKWPEGETTLALSRVVFMTIII